MAKIGKLASEITKQLQTYSKIVGQEVEKATDDVTKQAVKDIKSTSPVKTGAYAAGWTRKKVQGGYIVHNRTNYQLTHLLEFGHAKVGGGRVAGKVHIRPAEERAIKEFEHRIEKAVKQ